MITAPTAATVINVSIVNGLPFIAPTIARRAMGMSPTAMAMMKPQGCDWG